MKIPIDGFIFAFLLANGFAAEDENKLQEIFTNFADVFKTPDLRDTVTCSDPTPANFELLLYTRNNTKDPIHLSVETPELDATKKLVLLTHGWVQSGYAYGMPEMKDAYLKRYDCNVVMVNWENIALDFYSTSVCKLPKLAKIVTQFLCTLNSKFGVKLDSVHLVGHSLGAQMSGYMGQYSVSMCDQRIGRITGLDPAGPLFVDTPRSERLDSSDAIFVDVIHSNGGGLGYLGKCGHVDFFLNCGSVQMGCTLPDISLKTIVDLPKNAVICHHMRSLDVWAEAVNSDNFKATVCSYCPIGCPPILSFFSTKITMGEDCRRDVKGGYYVSTNTKSPYAKG